MLSIKLYLHIWALQADTIASLHCSHHQRDKLIRALWQQMQFDQYHTLLWKRTLDEQLRHILDNDTHTHTEVRAALHLFQATANHIAQNYDETWFSYAKEKYQASGEEYPTSDPFNDWATNNDDDDPVPW